MEPSLNLEGDLGDLPSLAFQKFQKLAKEVGLSIPGKFTAERRKAMEARLRDCGGPEGFQVALDHIRNSPYLRGQVAPRPPYTTSFRLNIDRFLDEGWFAGIMEGKYADRGPPAPATGNDFMTDVARGVAAWNEHHNQTEEDEAA